MNLRKGCALVLVGALPVVLAGCNYDSRNDDGLSSRNASSSGEITINKMGGGIDLADAPHGATLSTMGGDIHVGNVASFARLKTMGGEIEIDHGAGSVDATTMGGEITIGTSEGPVKATSMGGGITVREVRIVEPAAGHPTDVKGRGYPPDRAEGFPHGRKDYARLHADRSPIPHHTACGARRAGVG